MDGRYAKTSREPSGDHDGRSISWHRGASAPIAHCRPEARSRITRLSSKYDVAQPADLNATNATSGLGTASLTKVDAGIVSSVLHARPGGSSRCTRPVQESAIGLHGPAENPFPGMPAHFGPLETVNSTVPAALVAGGET